MSCLYTYLGLCKILVWLERTLMQSPSDELVEKLAPRRRQPNNAELGHVEVGSHVRRNTQKLNCQNGQNVEEDHERVEANEETMWDLCKGQYA